jgi:hypothetical protein
MFKNFFKNICQIGNDGTKPDDDSTTNLNALRQALGTTTRSNTGGKITKNKSTSTKDTTATALNNTTNNSNNNLATQQQKQRAGTPPYTTQKSGDYHKQNDGSREKSIKQTKMQKPQQKTSKSVEPQCGKKASSSMRSSISKEGDTAKQIQHSSKKRLYKSASTNEIFCAAGTKCKGYLNNKALVALGHFNKALLNSDEFDYMKDRYQEEEELLPDQIQHFLRHVCK